MGFIHPHQDFTISCVRGNRKYLFTHPLHYRQDVTLSILNGQTWFKFTFTSSLLTLKRLRKQNLHYFFLVAERRTDRFVLSSRAFARSQTQSCQWFELDSPITFPYDVIHFAQCPLPWSNSLWWAEAKSFLSFFNSHFNSGVSGIKQSLPKGKGTPLDKITIFHQLYM